MDEVKEKVLTAEEKIFQALNIAIMRMSPIAEHFKAAGAEARLGLDYLFLAKKQLAKLENKEDADHLFGYLLLARDEIKKFIKTSRKMGIATRQTTKDAYTAVRNINIALLQQHKIEHALKQLA